MEFNIEDELVQRGFVLDCEKDERSSYLDGPLSVTLHWDGDMIDADGHCVSMTIYNLNRGEKIYFGKRPTTKNEFDSLFKLLNLQ